MFQQDQLRCGPGPRSTLRLVLTTSAILIGLIAAFMVGVSKTALPGSAMLATPMIATVVEGRLLPGTTLPILIIGDLFAIAWYTKWTRWDLLKPLSTWVGLGFALGISFFVIIGSAARSLEVTIGLIVVAMVGVRVYRMLRPSDADVSPAAAATYGAAGGFATFVSNSAGPVMNSYLAGLKITKQELIGTSAWFFFLVNITKIPFYLALGAWSDGGHFFSIESITYDLVLVPAVVAGVFVGRAVLEKIPQKQFMHIVLALSAIGGLKLLVP